MQHWAHLGGKLEAWYSYRLQWCHSGLVHNKGAVNSLVFVHEAQIAALAITLDTRVWEMMELCVYYTTNIIWELWCAELLTNMISTFPIWLWLCLVSDRPSPLHGDTTLEGLTSRPIRAEQRIQVDRKSSLQSRVFLVWCMACLVALWRTESSRTQHSTGSRGVLFDRTSSL